VRTEYTVLDVRVRPNEKNKTAGRGHYTGATKREEKGQSKSTSHSTVTRHLVPNAPTRGVRSGLLQSQEKPRTGAAGGDYSSNQIEHQLEQARQRAPVVFVKVSKMGQIGGRYFHVVILTALGPFQGFAR
jgi:hypothetical protein